jgi:UDP-glucose 4-epimerase
MKEKILITGGAGFIGSAIIKELQKYHHEIFVIDNLSFGNRAFIDIDDTHFFQEDIRNEQEISNIISQISPSWIIHLAAIHFIPYCNQHPFESSDVNIRGTLNVLNAAKNLPHLKKLFFASTAAVYPISNIAVNENHPTLPLDIYGLSKLAGEELCKKFYLETSVPTIVCRFFNAFGPNETNAHLIPEIQQQINSGKRVLKLGNLDPKRDFIHTYDMARAVKLLMELSNNGYDTFNLGRGIEYSVREVVQAFSDELREEVGIEVDPNRVRRTERMHLLADISKLKNTINWHPEWSLEQGIKTLIQH